MYDLKFPKATADKDFVGLTLTKALNKGYEGQNIWGFGRGLFCTVYFSTPEDLIKFLGVAYDNLKGEDGNWGQCKIGHDWRHVSFEWNADTITYLTSWDPNKKEWPAGTWTRKKTPHVNLLGLTECARGLMGASMTFHMSPYQCYGKDIKDCEDVNYLLDGVFFKLNPNTFLIEDVNYCCPGG